jgi:hypothetical protein
MVFSIVEVFYILTKICVMIPWVGDQAIAKPLPSVQQFLGATA